MRLISRTAQRTCVARATEPGFTSEATHRAWRLVPGRSGQRSRPLAWRNRDWRDMIGVSPYAAECDESAWSQPPPLSLPRLNVREGWRLCENTQCSNSGATTFHRDEHKPSLDARSFRHAGIRGDNVALKFARLSFHTASVANSRAVSARNSTFATPRASCQKASKRVRYGDTVCGSRPREGQVHPLPDELARSVTPRTWTMRQVR